MIHIILENVAGKLDERFSSDDVESIRHAVFDLALETKFRDGDVIRIVEREKLP